MGVRWFEGLGDTLGCLADAAGDAGDAAIVLLQRDLESAFDARPATVAAARVWLRRLDASVAAVAALMARRAVPAGASAAAADTAFWTSALVRQMQALRDEFALFAAWSVPQQAPDTDGDGLDARPMPTLRELASLDREQLRVRDVDGSAGPASADPAAHADGTVTFADACRRAAMRLAEIERLARECEELAGMEYDFLYDRARHLLAIGYNVGERRRDASYYDLLASEARFSSFVAIAQGRLPQENWFALGRLLTTAGGQSVLLSWSGSMFEYLMPLLVMPAYENTLLDQTCRATVDRQIAYGRQRGVPWGISECGYNAVDASLNYQYRAFGVPGLGLKRGLAEDLVVAPYASALALMVAPEAACLNLQRLAADGLAGRFGLYEAVDYTPARRAARAGRASSCARSWRITRA